LILKSNTGFLCLLFAVLLAAGLSAQVSEPEPAFETHLDYAQVIFVRVSGAPEPGYRFEVTVRHTDEGWDHYADAWQVLEAETGQVLPGGD